MAPQPTTNLISTGWFQRPTISYQKNLSFMSKQQSRSGGRPSCDPKRSQKYHQFRISVVYPYSSSTLITYIAEGTKERSYYTHETRTNVRTFMQVKKTNSRRGPGQALQQPKKRKYSNADLCDSHTYHPHAKICEQLLPHILSFLPTLSRKHDLQPFQWCPMEFPFLHQFRQVCDQCLTRRIGPPRYL